MDCIELVERSVRQLLGSSATVEHTEDEHGVIIEIFNNDNGPLIGRHGATIQALSTLAKALGYNGKHRIKVVLRERPKS